jgi:hypothetical protein
MGIRSRDYVVADTETCVSLGSKERIDRTGD